MSLDNKNRADRGRGSMRFKGQPPFEESSSAGGGGAIKSMPSRDLRSHLETIALQRKVRDTVELTFGGKHKEGAQNWEVTFSEHSLMAIVNF